MSSPSTPAGATPPAVYYKIAEPGAAVRWYCVSPFVNHNGQQITEVIDELLAALNADFGITSDKQSDMPPAGDLGDDGLRDYASLKAFLARHVIGLD